MIEIFVKRVPHAGSFVFDWLMDSPINLFFLLTPCSSIAFNIHECGTESQAFW